MGSTRPAHRSLEAVALAVQKDYRNHYSVVVAG